MSRQAAICPRSDRVASYSARGEATLLPSLQTPRSSHACGYYYTNGQVVREGDTSHIRLSFKETLSQTYLVTGGRSGDISGSLASTELLHQDASQWVYSGPLPSARDCLKGATLDNKLIITGELDVIKISEAYNHNHNVYII